ncbi:MAG: histone deacetylase family protein [Syntrophobacteraceae bacterium]|jgi:acetoin utilization deacetylase AcuC-like enzyme|nr:histone deacetylase family protein [Syntrophobacteraceae bacterium]
MLKIIYHEDYLTDYFTSAAESPLRVKAIYRRLRDHFETVTPEAASPEDILRVHTSDHLEGVQSEGAEVYRTALLSSGGALCAARLAMEGMPAFAIIRPPGHHAKASSYSGFCFFNNMAVAVTSLLAAGSIRRVAIIDFDMHHGDGTEAIFRDHPAVDFIEVRARTRERYLGLLELKLRWLGGVDLIAVSAGFDLYVRDWGGLLETDDYHYLGYLIRQAAQNKAGCRCFALLEGGYFVNDLGKNALAFCLGLSGEPPSVLCGDDDDSGIWPEP